MFKYKLPHTSSEYDVFRKDPIGWIKGSIETNLPNDRISASVFETASMYDIKPDSRDFYIVLAFIALMMIERLENDFQAYRANKPNPSFYANLIKKQSQ